MKFSEEALRQLFNPKLEITTEALCHQLTMLGLEVEECMNVAPLFSGVVVGKVMTAEKHPDADRLHICTVNVGEETSLKIVCGTPNARAGIKVAVARIGAILPGDFEIKETKIRGVVSCGMLCSETELGLPETTSGIIELPDDAPLGCDLRKYLMLDDHVININLTPNRADCLSIYGIAREIAVLNELPVPGFVAPELTINKNQQCLKVNVSAPDACPSYWLASIENVDNTVATPADIKLRLERAGIRSVSAVVDILNDVMMLCGQPMHAFDADKITGAMSVKYAKAGENITLLNEEHVSLRADTLTIRDEHGAIAIAGVMGSGPSGVTKTTTRMLIESAFFTPLALAGQARSYGLHTDASHRFERGVDPALAAKALAFALQKIEKITGGKVIEVIEKEFTEYLPEMQPVSLFDHRISKLLGISIDREFSKKTFQALGCDIVEENSQVLVVLPPSYRFDLEIEEDLIEELARFTGYDNLPFTLPVASLKTSFCEENITSMQRIKNSLIAQGMSEAVTYSFIAESLQSLFFPVEAQYQLVNPISKELNSMRKSLIPSLLSILQYNVSRQQEDLAIFEVGMRFTGKAPVEMETLAGLIYGQQESWHKKHAPDFYDLKGLIEKLMAFAHLSFSFETENLPHYIHPGQGISIVQEGEMVGYFGALHPKFLLEFDLAATPFLFEMDAAVFNKGKVPRFSAISRFPVVIRDLAFIVDEALTAETLMRVIKKNPSPLLHKVSIFDVYTGAHLPENKKSLAIKLFFQDYTRTLSEEEVNQVLEEIIREVEGSKTGYLRRD